MDSIIQQLKEADPHAPDVGLTAVQTFQTYQEIRTFCRKYVEHLEQHGINEHMRRMPRHFAKNVLMYANEFFQPKAFNKWKKVIEEELNGGVVG